MNRESQETGFAAYINHVPGGGTEELHPNVYAFRPPSGHILS
ncbi:MAG: hypothetical protein JWM43_2534 [Acidobacteriaceae bacterium]|nr:hypothetical protein [Acidobacteriaceae bacterium]